MIDRSNTDVAESSEPTGSVAAGSRGDRTATDAVSGQESATGPQRIHGKYAPALAGSINLGGRGTLEISSQGITATGFRTFGGFITFVGIALAEAMVRQPAANRMKIVMSLL